MTSLTLVKAQIELDRLGTPAGEPGRNAVERLLGVLVEMPEMDSQGAREWVVDIFARLAGQQVLSPLSGESWEWRMIPPHLRAGGFNMQNIRESSVMAKAEWIEHTEPAVDEFKVYEAIDTQALKFRRDGWADGAVMSEWMHISFPYMPQRYHMQATDDDPRSNEEIIESARETLAGEQIQVTGGRTA